MIHITWTIYAQNRSLTARILEDEPQFRVQIILKTIKDRGQRLRDTLLHEMIHAANWIIDENAKAGHGPQFKYWAQIASKIHPEIPRVTTTHSYEINYKYWWECERVSTGWCNVKIGRKSNSLDVNRVRCAICKGKFIYVRFKYYKK